MREFGVAFLFAIVFLVAGSIAPEAAFAAPHIRLGASSSTNWSGYAVTGPRGSVSDVRGSWIVPSVACAASETSYSSFWVGIDGYNSNSVEQTGTDSDCRAGVPTYYAWYEFYPKPSYRLAMAIHPGDSISARVDLVQGKFVLLISDQTTGGQATLSSKVPNVARSSAEWVAEAPSSSGGILPLADFSSVAFSAGSAAVGGPSAPIGSYGSSIQSITMVTQAGVVKALPSALGADGAAFSVDWKSAGP